MPKPYAALLALICSMNALAQDSSSSSKIIEEARQFAVNSYYNYTGKQGRLFNGIDHPGYYSSIKGNAYYVNDTLVRGNVTYDGLFFSPVMMMYDVFKDELVIRHPSGLRIALLTEKLQEFNMRGHHFVHHSYDSLAKSSVPNGMYDHVYEGKTTMMVHRIKRMEEKVTDEVVREFVPDDHYYFLRDGIYHGFKTKAAFYKAFGNKSGEVKRFLRKNKIRFKTERERAIIEAAKYYDTLI